MSKSNRPTGPPTRKNDLPDHLYNPDIELKVLKTLVFQGEFAQVDTHGPEYFLELTPRYSFYQGMRLMRRRGESVFSMHALTLALVEMHKTPEEIEHIKTIFNPAGFSDGIPISFDLVEDWRTLEKLARRRAQVRRAELSLADAYDRSLSHDECDEHDRDRAQALLAYVSSVEGQPFKTAKEIAESTPQNTDWIVSGYLPRGGITEIDGKIKASGKTTLIAAIVHSIVTGADFLGMKVKQGPVVYLTEQSEITFRDVLRRANLLDSEDVHILTWSRSKGDWNQKVASAAAKCREVGSSTLIVDTLAQFSGLTGDQENLAGEALKVMAPLQLVAGNDNIGIFISRHDRKTGGEPGESARGSSAYGGSVDIILQLKRPEGKTRPTIRVLSSLSRFDETPGELVIELVDGEYVPLGTAQDVAHQEAMRAVYRYLPLEAAKAIRQAEIIKLTGLPKVTAQRGLAALEEQGHARRTGDGTKGNPVKYFRDPDSSGFPSAHIHRDSLGQSHSNISQILPLKDLDEDNSVGPSTGSLGQPNQEEIIRMQLAQTPPLCMGQTNSDDDLGPESRPERNFQEDLDAYLTPRDRRKLDKLDKDLGRQ